MHGLSRELEAIGAAEAIEENRCYRAGEVSVQKYDGSFKVTLPKLLCENAGIEKGESLEVYYVPSSGAIVSLPADD